MDEQLGYLVVIIIIVVVVIIKVMVQKVSSEAGERFSPEKIIRIFTKTYLTVSSKRDTYTEQPSFK